MNDLRDLLHDAVDGVEPAERLHELRARTASPQHAAARPWFWAAGATVLATAAAVAVVAVVSDDSDAPSHHHPGMAMDPPSATQLVAAYFTGGTPDGPRLFREFDEVPPGDPLQEALDRIERPANDRDYSTKWTADSFGSVTLKDDGIHVEVNDPAAVRPNDVAVQQVVYTLQAAAGRQLPVWFEGEGQRGNAPVTAAPQLDVLNPVSISDPAEGNEYAGSMIARGRVRSTELLLDWDVLDGQTVVTSGNPTIDTGQGSFSPWSAEVDLSGLAPGRYTFRVSTGNVGYGAEPFADTRTINVR